VVAAVPDAQLRVLGDGPLAPLLAAAGPSVMHVRPDATRRAEQVRDLLRSAMAVVSPSRTAPDGDAESLLLVNVEAMATQRLVISTRHGGIPEYVRDGENGLLVEEGDPSGLAAAVVRGLQNKQLAARLAAAGVETARGLDVRTRAAAVDDLYDELLAK